MQNKKFLVFVILTPIFLFLGFANAQTAAPSVIWGHVKNGEGFPMTDVQIWYCTSTVPETFPQCAAKELTKSTIDGKWSFSGGAPSLYYRIWATFPSSYSNTITLFYAGGEQYWGEIILANNPAPTKPSTRLIYPNGGEKLTPGAPLTIQWATYKPYPNATISATLFRSSKNPVREAFCSGGSCTESTYNFIANVAYKTKDDGSESWTISGGVLPAADYFVRVYCRDEVLNESCGGDDSDNPFSIGIVQAPSPQPPPPPPVVSAVEPPPPVLQTSTVTKPATEEIVAETKDGAKVVVPPEAAVTSGTVTVAIKIAAEPQKESGIELASAVYDVTLKDQASKLIKDLAGEIEIVLPYSEVKFKKLGVAEDKLFPAYFDESAAHWVKIENYSQDKAKNIITARVKHLTRFAIVSAADITPPAPPTNAEAEALDDGRIKLTWKNPSRDFNNAKIYRSEVKGKLGKIFVSEVLGEKFEDEDTQGGVSYFYTVRAVDPAGNESQNITQVSARALATHKKAGSQLNPPEEPKSEVKQPAESQPETTPSLAEKSGFWKRLWISIGGLFKMLF